MPATIRALFAVHSTHEEWQEQLITENPEYFAAAEEWAREQGFDRFRIVEIDATQPPVFGANLIGD